jgi:hypothetical protein
MVSRRRPIVPAMLAVIGGAAIVAGSLLTWLNVPGGVSVGAVAVTGTPRGTELLFGKVVLGTGIAVVVFGLLLLAIHRIRRLLGLLVVVGGILAVATGAYVAFTPTDRYVDFAAAEAAPNGQLSEVTASLTRLFEASNLQADPEIGLYAVMGGGLLAAIGGLVAFFVRRASKPVEDEPAVSEPLHPNSDRPDETPAPSLGAAIPGAVTGAAPEAHGLGGTEASAQPAGETQPEEPEGSAEMEDPARAEETIGAMGPRSDALWVAGPAPSKKRGLRIFRRHR